METRQRAWKAQIKEDIDKLTLSLEELMRVDIQDEIEKHKTIGISSGASAPEILVDNFINNLKKQFTVKIEEVEIVKENITFKIPGKLN